ncbi:hypothetical protein CEE37_04265 [candidate division LCP-89 bacterium B3_LCP]|uniref:Peptidase S8/S53 domain-containing protein n=1 Tax=candidate division LCP-89 bacterium B3_LCP TaxID=2012998 RepID=A0A532V3J7_UNCL8|nr:MAG: hypothetical protein CEE37_04265 [candidate division LCP-89 bacterium B3_LCP]
MKSPLSIRFFGLIVLFAFLALCLGAEQVYAEKIKIEQKDDLPAHSYTTKMKAIDIVKDAKALKKLAKRVKKDLEKDLKKYDIQDKTTLKEYYGNLGIIAFVNGRWDDYLHYLDLRTELEDKESTKLTRGLFAKSYIKALRSGEDVRTVFKREYTAAISPLPYDVVGDDLESSKGRAEIFTENLIIGIIQERIQPILDKTDGEMDKDMAMTLVGDYYLFEYYIPNKDIVLEVLTAYLDAHKVEKPDIWADRDVNLTAENKGKPVLIGVWDAGVDMSVFKENCFINKKEKPGNGKDDDHNGFVDDVHGIAFDLNAHKTPDLLYPIGEIQDRPRLQHLTKGLSDLTSNIDSKESSDVKKMLGSLEPEKVKPFIEDLGKYGNYCHGTHVAGIVARGNPFAKILAARLTFDHRMIPLEPTIAKARRDSAMMIETVNYFKEYGVRVVNMSWGYTLDEVEAALEANGAGGTVEERKELTRQIFDIVKHGLFQAIKSAPEILFITAAGNSNNDVIFDDVIPSAFDLPNLMSIGAVDQAGDETGFTSFGKVDAYANGFEVMSYVPGGDQMALSGTSMASPNVTNLAGKLFAMRPGLKPAQVRKLIEKACDENKAGDRTVKLMNPKRSFEMLKKM